jgi:hypothetical protein
MNAASAAYGPDWGHYLRGATMRCPILHSEDAENRLPPPSPFRGERKQAQMYPPAVSFLVGRNAVSM